MDGVTITTALEALKTLFTECFHSKPYNNIFLVYTVGCKCDLFPSATILKVVDRQPNPQASVFFFSLPLHTVKYKHMQSILLSQDCDLQRAV